MRRIGTLIKKDLIYATRENILLYVLLAPLFISLIFRAFLPSLENMELTFAVDSSVPVNIVQGLEQYGKVEIVTGPDRVAERVLMFDDVPGIYMEAGQFVVVLEGNEQSYVRDLPGTLIDYLKNGGSIDITKRSLGHGRSLGREYGAILVMMTCMAIGALGVGISIVDDRQTRTIRALSVSPVRTGSYLMGKSVFGMLAAVILAVASAAIITGGELDYLRLSLGAASALPWSLAAGLLMGYVCANQLTAIAMLKVLSLALLGIPGVAIFMPAKYAWVLYPFPNYWSFESLRRALIEPTVSSLPANVLSLAIGGAMLAALFPLLKRKFHM